MAKSHPRNAKKCARNSQEMKRTKKQNDMKWPMNYSGQQIS